MTQTRRAFAPGFTREAVALRASSGRPLMRVATELGIEPAMLRGWRAVMRGGSPRSGAAAFNASPMPSPADRAGEIARLKRALDRTRMERGVLND